MRTRILASSEILQPFKTYLATFKIPSALAIEEFSKDDLHHLHWGIAVGDPTVVDALRKRIAISPGDLIANARQIARSKYPDYSISDPYQMMNAAADERYRDIMVMHWNAILQDNFQGTMDPFFVETVDFQDAVSLLKKLKAAADPVSSYLTQRSMEEYPDFNTLLASYNEEQPPSAALLEALAKALNRVIKKIFYNSTVFASVSLSEETLRLLAQNPPSGDDLFLLNRLLLEDAYPNEIVKVTEKARPDGFLVRQNRLVGPDVLPTRQPFSVYHSYERRNNRVGEYPPGSGLWQWSDDYISPQAVKDHKLFFHGDPIDNIRTDLSSPQPQLMFPPGKAPINQSPTVNELEGASVLFFVNRKGQIVICPDPGMTRRPVSLPGAKFTSFVEALQAADAIDGIDW
jgi:hypothetical protein